MFDYYNDKPRRKAIPSAVKYTVWSKYIGADKAEGKCYVCGKTIHITEFDLGHNKAKSKGGGDSISNLRPICRTCNTSMHTTSIEIFKARHFDKPKENHKQALETLTIKQLKFLADKHHIRVKGSVVENYFEASHTKAPTKKQYITKLFRIVTVNDLSSVPKESPKPVKKKKAKKSDDSWW